MRDPFEVIPMLEIALPLLALLLLDLAALRWGYDSRDGFRPTLRRH